MQVKEGTEYVGIAQVQVISTHSKEYEGISRH